MAQVVVMPQLGNTVESCLVTSWLVAVGDVVDANTLLCEIETDKSAMEVPAGVSGTVLALLAEEGDEVPVKQPIVVIGEPGEALPDDLATPVAEPDEAPVAETPESVAEVGAIAPSLEAGTSEVSDPSRLDLRSTSGIASVSPRARGLAAEQGIAAGQLAGTGPGGRVIARDVEAAIAAGPALTAGARAEASGFVPGAVGSGIGGRVTRADLTTVSAPVEGSSAEASGLGAVAPTSAIGTEFPGEVTETPLKGIRKVIAERMMNSLATSAQLTYTATAPAAGLLALRKRLKNVADPELAGVTIGDLVGYATKRRTRREADLLWELLFQAFADLPLTPSAITAACRAALAADPGTIYEFAVSLTLECPNNDTLASSLIEMAEVQGLQRAIRDRSALPLYLVLLRESAHLDISPVYADRLEALSLQVRAVHGQEELGKRISKLVRSFHRGLSTREELSWALADIHLDWLASADLALSEWQGTAQHPIVEERSEAPPPKTSWADGV